MGSKRINFDFDLGATGGSMVIPFEDFSSGSFDVNVVTSTAVGTLKFQSSTNGTDWNDVELSSPIADLAGANVQETIQLTDFAPPLGRFYYTRTSGTGIATISGFVKDN